jgi:hypothetical protein
MLIKLYAGPMVWIEVNSYNKIYNFHRTSLKKIPTSCPRFCINLFI